MLVKILHMTFGMLVILNFIVLCYILLTPRTRTETRMKVLKTTQHICYALVVLFGIWQLIPLLPHNVPDWVWAKIILFIVAVSASAKAYRATNPTQLKVGLIVAAIAYIGIIWLVSTKPNLGHQQSSIQNKPVSNTSTSASSNTASSTPASSTQSSTDSTTSNTSTTTAK